MVTTTQPQPQPPSTATATPAEDEILKRNTDCVYFLASPLTCKKGSECEYRHSEYARVNPRDCYYWLNGNCLNPKCGFRHPPLDGLFGTQAAASGSSLPPLHTAVSSATHTAYNSVKQAVPCIFFQKGLCLKGDRCAFSHGPYPTSNSDKVRQSTAANPATQPLPPKKAFIGLNNCNQEKNTPQAKFSKAAEATSDAKPAPKAEIVPPRNAVGMKRNVPAPKSADAEVRMHKPTSFLPIVNGNSSRLNRSYQSQITDDHVLQISKDTDEFLRESSPGFDVLVDDDLRDSDYYHGEDQYGRIRDHGSRNLKSMDEYEKGHSTDYNSMVDIDQVYRDARGYDSDEYIGGHHAWDQRSGSSERIIEGTTQHERRGHVKSDCPEQIDESDLRYQLSKRRRVGGLRSVVSHDFVSENNVGLQLNRGSSIRDAHHLPSHESSISSRLRARIKLPGRSPNDERDMDRGRNRGRLSPSRSQIPHQGWLRDRINARVDDDHIIAGKSSTVSRIKRETMDNGSADFAGPKSLAEIKEGKVQQFIGKRKHSDDRQPSEGDLSFEGPMPLGEILRRKREAEATGYGGISPVNKDNDQKGSNKSLTGSSNNTAIAEKPSHLSSVLKDEANTQIHKELKSTTDGAIGTAVENTEVGFSNPSQLPNPSDLETEDGMIMVDDGTEHDYEGEDPRDGDYEYEQGDEGDYNYEDGENVDAEEEEYVDEEDGDDFAKKIDGMFS